MELIDITTTALEPLFSVNQIANHLGCDPVTVRKLIADGKLRAFRLGHAFKIPESAYREYLTEAGGGVAPLIVARGA